MRRMFAIDVLECPRCQPDHHRWLELDPIRKSRCLSTAISRCGWTSDRSRLLRDAAPPISRASLDLRCSALIMKRRFRRPSACAQLYLFDRRRNSVATDLVVRALGIAARRDDCLDVRVIDGEHSHSCEIFSSACALSIVVRVDSSYIYFTSRKQHVAFIAWFNNNVD